MGWVGLVARIGHNRCTCRVLVERLEEKRTLGRHRRRWEYNIKMDLQEVGSRGMDWIDHA
jgi:DNA-binding IclR family transcriptional regulator